MKFKRSITKVIIIGSIFFISAVSFAGFISLQNDDINSFWVVKKIDLSLINKTYADDDNDDDNKKSSKKKHKDDDDEDDDEDEDDDKKSSKKKRKDDDDDDYKKSSKKKITTSKTTKEGCIIEYDSITTASGSKIIEPKEICNDTKKLDIINNPVSIATKQSKIVEFVKNQKITSISDYEKEQINNLFLNFSSEIDNSNYTDLKKLNLFKSVSTIIYKEISDLNNLIIKTTDKILLEKYQKKLLLLEEVNLHIESKVSFYTKKIDINLKSALKVEEKLAAQAAADAKAKSAAQAAADAKAKSAAQAAANAKAKSAAQAAADAKAKSAAQAAADAKAKAAAQAAANAKTNTKTKAS